MLNNDYNFASYQAKFAMYLKGEKYPDTSVKSSLEDVEHFVTWAKTVTTHHGFRLSQQNTLESVFNYRALEQYISFCSQEESQPTVKRRIAALRSFSQLAVSEKWLSNKISVAFQMLADQSLKLLKTKANRIQAFSEHLQRTNQNKNTLRGYLADVEEYLQITSSI